MTAAADSLPGSGEAYDFIVVGAGSAGCLLANRLSADPSQRVLVVEAGGRDNWIWFHIPVGYLFAIGNPRADWRFETEAEPGLGGRRLAYPRGRVIGGSSAINAMIYMRGQAADYDGWRQRGLEGWGWDEVLPYFLRHEDHEAPPSPCHRSGGELRVEYPRVRWDLLDRIRDAAESAGIAKIEDFNGGDNAGSSYFQVTQRRGRRWSAATAFLKPALTRKNLTLLTHAEIERVLFEGPAARGVVLREGGQKRIANLRPGGEVILAAGAIGSPALLERSGIGDGERLTGIGVTPIHQRRGVGENLQDHLQIRPVYRVANARTLNGDYRNLFRRGLMGLDYVLRRRGPLTMAPSQVGAFARSSERYETANLEFHFQPLSLDKWGEGLHRFPAFTASVCNLRPSSRGSSHATAADDPRAVAIRPNYLATQEDRQVAVEALKLTRRIVSQPALSGFHPEEVSPGPGCASDADLLAAAGELGTTIFHPVGTARMGLADDPDAVVDGRLRVIGLQGLRVVDASVMPTITSGNTNAPTMMIAEKGAAMILEDRRR
ncbi:GMC family oxidoreductase [Bosea sp. (in: a-proteobacteria)]|uniref:GMC family oxidoreductase n=1 Tax=Bosea sp. (in: a-proteobacteria) TaxID=1871050 RepID=UPI002621CADD|nr:GMC family oxidoreductase N-terminal domain-containing protein [Bosea sp. (in: a-proteobacteria)]MCO5092912.1 GMC family oxidoreductase N-terminal domain-containing protein [Bosea sp. (in: a-proteobacteria)]